MRRPRVGLGTMWAYFFNFTKLEWQTIGETSFFSLIISFSNLPNHKIWQMIFTKLLEML